MVTFDTMPAKFTLRCKLNKSDKHFLTEPLLRVKTLSNKPCLGFEQILFSFTLNSKIEYMVLCYDDSLLSDAQCK